MTEETVKTREATHGVFARTARVACALVDALGTGPFTAVQRESLAMICTKLARITCGDPNFADHWRDIAGYALLALKEIEHEVR